MRGFLRTRSGPQLQLAESARAVCALNALRLPQCYRLSLATVVPTLAQQYQSSACHRLSHGSRCPSLLSPMSDTGAT